MMYESGHEPQDDSGRSEAELGLYRRVAWGLQKQPAYLLVFGVSALFVLSGFANSIAAVANQNVWFGVLGVLSFTVALGATLIVVRHVERQAGAATSATPLKTGHFQTLRLVDASSHPTLLLDILRKKQVENRQRRVSVRVLAADARHLLSLLDSVIRVDWLRRTQFEFAVVNPRFERIDEGSPRFRSNAQEALELLCEMSEDPKLAANLVTILPPRTYNYLPNTWGVLINDSELLLGFLDWVTRQDGARLEGTQQGLFHLSQDDPLWNRFHSLFTSWFEHSEVTEVRSV